MGKTNPADLRAISPEDKARHDLEKARLRYLKACRGTTVTEASHQVAQVLRDRLPRGGHISHNLSDDPVPMNGYHITVRRSFHVEVNIYVRFVTQWEGRLTNPDNDLEVLWPHTCEATVNWGCCGSMGVTLATAKLALFREAVDLVADVQVAMDQLTIFRIDTRS
jgi:hypothetical protein